MTVKKMFIELADGRTYSLPVHVIAADRAAYYAARDKDTDYKDEYDFVMRDSSEAHDWLFNNMNWYEHGPTLEKAAVPPDLKDAEVDNAYVKEG